MADAVDLRGTTRVAAVIGSPISHSRSPSIVNAAFAAAGLDWAFVAFDVGAGRAEAAVAAMRSLGLGGLSVTMPHKEAVLPALDRVSDAAVALRAVNCIAWEGDELVGHNTDGDGLLRSLRLDAGVEVDGRRCAVLGAGGAARSVVRALAIGGAERVAVVNRTEARAREAAALGGAVAEVAEVAVVAEADLVVNATSVGMGERGPDAPSPVPEGLLHDGQVVVDLVYTPLETALLRQAERAGARGIDGLGMLVHQAALAVERWTGVAPDVAAMRDAAR
ncbi:MAG: shikimate dehydrogenase [Acidimicrobiales bacterium]|nr:shikimate dehydrogenase [Acidimicrobiales bacterium]HRW37514.1 shikimate dehydrogenase [Aquihabitans sp.]